MKSIALAAALAVASIAAPAFAQAPAAPAAAPAGKPTINTKINDLIKVPAAKAVLEKVLPGVDAYYGMIGDSTVAQLPEVSQGQVNADQVKQIEAELAKLP